MAHSNISLNTIHQPWRLLGLTHLFDRDHYWPAPWDAYWSKVNPMSQTVWTYRDLAVDLSGQPDPERRNLLSRLIKSLAWPGGSITFWPYSVLHGDRPLRCSFSLFWRGVSIIRPKFLVSFDKEPHDHFFPGRDFSPLSCSCYQGLDFCFLPGLDLISSDKGLFQDSLQFLAARFSSLETSLLSSDP